jgi:methylisocitrate lyase
MAAKIAAARKTRRCLVVVARTDAIASEGLEKAIDRARLYVKAGADAVFPEALTTEAMFREFIAVVGATPLLANMTEFGKSPAVSAKELEALNYKMVIWPVSSLRIANRAQEVLYRELAEHGTTASLIDNMQTRAQLYDLIDLKGYEALDSSIIASRVPS